MRRSPACGGGEFEQSEAVVDERRGKKRGKKGKRGKKREKGARLEWR
jgi:hypothetical protein